MTHLDNIRKIMFCVQGDVIANFTEYLFEKDAESTVKNAMVINDIFDMAIRSLSDENPLKELFSFSFKTKKTWGINAFNLEDHFKLNYNVDHPLTLIFDEQAIEKYNKIFFFLLRLRRFDDLLKIIWNFTNSARLRKSDSATYTKIRKVQLLRIKMQHFLNNMNGYFMNEIVDKLWARFNQNLVNISRFEDIIILHKEYLNHALDKCFLNRIKEGKVGELMDQMLDLIRQLFVITNSNSIFEDYAEFGIEDQNNITSEEFMAKVHKLDQAFDQYYRKCSSLTNLKLLFLPTPLQEF